MTKDVKALLGSRILPHHHHHPKKRLPRSPGEEIDAYNYYIAISSGAQSWNMQAHLVLSGTVCSELYSKSRMGKLLSRLWLPEPQQALFCTSSNCTCNWDALRWFWNLLVLVKLFCSLFLYKRRAEENTENNHRMTNHHSLLWCNSGDQRHKTLNTKESW